MIRIRIRPFQPGHPVPSLRGVHLGDSELPFVEDDIARIKQEVGATCIRFGVEPLWLTDEQGTQWKDDGFAYVRRVLDWCAAHGMYCIVDLHNAPGRLRGGDPRLWTEKHFQQRFVALWGEITRRLSDHPAVIAWELLNEPEPPNDDTETWNTLAARAVDAVRRTDRRRAVIVDSIAYARPAFVPCLQTVVENAASEGTLVFSFHNYQPTPYHRQKRRELEDQSTYYYPGFIPLRPPSQPQDFRENQNHSVDGRFWNRQQLLDQMRPALQLGVSDEIPVFCGEFGCVSDVPAGTDAMYLLDQISIFHEYGVGWTMYNAMWRTTDPYWKDHFDCCLYVDYAPEGLLRRNRRKISLLEMVCRAEGETLRLHQPQDQMLGVMGVRRPDSSCLVLLWNKDRQSAKRVSLDWQDVDPGHRLVLRTMGPADETFVYRGAPVVGADGAAVDLPPLTVAAVTCPPLELWT